MNWSTCGVVHKRMRFIPVALIIPLLAGCLPGSGPGASRILASADGAAPPYDVIALNTSVADALAANQYDSLASSFASRGGAADLRIGVGDTVVVTIFEAAAGGLFSGEAGASGGTKSVNLPPQPVARNGMITVPYVGQVKAAGSTPAQVQKQIESALREKAIEPQVIVTVSDNPSTFVTVTGEVGSSGRIPLNLNGDRLLDIIAAAGGSRAAAYDTFVRVTRGSTSRTVSLARIIDDPDQNIFLQPDDQIYVYKDAQMYTAFGATAQNASYPFESDRLTLAEAMGRAGGVLDTRADARGVFIFRYEKPDVYATISDGERAPAPESGGIPVVYNLDLKEPSGFFTAQRFLMRDNDVIYVSNAPSTDLQKFFGIINGSVGVASSTTGLAARSLSP